MYRETAPEGGRASLHYDRRQAARGIPFDGRFRFLVALVPVRDLRVCAKHLFV